MLSNWHACQRELVSSPKVRLHERTHCPAAESFRQFAGGCACPTFELITKHTGPTPNIAFFDRAGLCGIQRAEHMLFFYMESIQIIQPAVRSLCHHRAGPALIQGIIFYLPRDDRITYETNAM